MNRFVYAILITGLVCLFSCKKDKENPSTDAASQNQSIRSFLSENENDSASSFETSDGYSIYHYPISLNSDQSAASIGTSSVISFTYEVRTLDGQVVSAFQSTDSVFAKVGASAIYPIGLDLALRESGIRAGEEYGFVLPSPYAFGEFAVNNLLPANSILDYRVRVLNVYTETEISNIELARIQQYVNDNELNDTTKNPVDFVVDFQNGISFKRRTENPQGITPLAGNSVSISYRLEDLNSNVIDIINPPETFDFVLGGSGTSIGNVIPGLDFAVAQMREGERALALLPSAQAYNESAQVVPVFFKDEMAELEIIPVYAVSVSPYQVLIFDLNLRSVTN